MKNSYPFLLLIPVLLLAGCGKPSTPSDSEVLTFLNSQVPPANPVEFTSLQADKYPDGNGHCQVKVKVTARCKTDLYHTVGSLAALKSVGWDESTYTSAVSAASALNEPYKSQLAGKISESLLKGVALTEVATPSGKECTVYGVIEADRQPDRWTFTVSDLQDTAASFPGRTADSISRQGVRCLALDSDDARKLLTDEMNREKDFVAAVKAAQDQMAASRQAQAQADAQKHQQFVQALLNATAPGKSYTGTLLCDNGQSATIKLVFTGQQEGGKILAARFENPGDSTQTKTYNGTITFDEHDANPIKLNFDHNTFTKAAKDDALSRWLSNNYEADGCKFHVESDGGLTGAGFFRKFNLKPADGAVAAPAP